MKKGKRLLVILLALAITFTFMPTTAFAGQEFPAEDPVDEVQEQTEEADLLDQTEPEAELTESDAEAGVPEEDPEVNKPETEVTEEVTEPEASEQEAAVDEPEEKPEEEAAEPEQAEEAAEPKAAVESEAEPEHKAEAQPAEEQESEPAPKTVPKRALETPIDELNVENISYTMAEDIVLYEHIDGYWDTRWVDDEEYSFFWYQTWTPFVEGSVLTINDTINLTYQEDDEAFYDEDGDYVMSRDEVTSYDDQQIEPWEYGKDNKFRIEFRGCTCYIPVTIEKSPVQEISFELSEDLLIREKEDGYWTTRSYTDDEGNEQEEEFFCYNIPFTSEGNRLIVNGGEEIYTCTWGEDEGQYVFFDENSGKTIYADGGYRSISYVDNQYENPWGPGEANELTVKYMGQSCTVSVPIEENPIKSISFSAPEPYVFYENLGGYWEESEDGTSERFMYADFNIFYEGCTITINDTDTYTYHSTNEDNGYYDDGFYDEEGNRNGDLDAVNGYADQAQRSWSPDGENYIKITYSGAYCMVPVTVIPLDVQTISFESAEPIEIMEETNGYVESTYDPESGEETGTYYYYNIPGLFAEGNTLTINDSIVFTCDGYYYVDQEGRKVFNPNGQSSLELSSDQNVDHWLPDKENHFTIHFKNTEAECSVPVTITANPVKSISFEPSVIEIAEYTTGEWDMTYEYDDETGEDQEVEYFRYNVNNIIGKPGNKITVNGDTVYEYQKVYWESYGGDRYGFYNEELGEFLDDNQLEFRYTSFPAWQAGEDHIVTVNYMGKTCEMTARIVPNPIETAEFIAAEPYVYMEGTNCWISENGDPIYERPNIYEPGNIIRINGDELYVCEYVENEGYCFLDSEGNIAINGKYGTVLSNLPDGQEDEPWGPGEHVFPFRLGNLTLEVKVLIKENPVQSIEFSPSTFDIAEYTYGYWNETERYDEETDEYYSEEYFRYSEHVILKSPGNSITLNGDQVYVYDPEEGLFYNEELDEYLNEDELSFGSDQNEQWQQGEHTFTISYMGKSCDVAVNVEPNPIETAEFIPEEPIEFLEGNNGYYNEDDVYIYEAPHIWREGNIIRVNGDTEYTCEYSDNGGYYYVDEENNIRISEGNDGGTALHLLPSGQEEEPWGPGEHVFRYQVGNAIMEVPVLIKANPVQTVEISPSSYSFIEHTNGYWRLVDEYDDDGEVIGTRQLYYYYLVSTLYREGTSITVNGDQVYEYIPERNDFYNSDGQCLTELDQFDVYADQEEEWTAGNSYTGEFELCGKRTEVTYIIEPSPVESAVFVPAKPIEWIEYTHGEYDEEGNGYYIYDSPLCSAGNKIIVNFVDGSETVLEYKYDEDEDLWGFFDEEGNYADITAEYSLDKQDTEPWGVGQHSFYASYLGFMFEIPVTIIGNPVISIDFEFAPENAVYYENYDGRYDYDEEGERFFVYNEKSVEEEGNKLTVVTDEGTKEYIFHYRDPYRGWSESGFYDEEGILAIEEDAVKGYSNQYGAHWTLGSDNYYTVTYMGKDCQVPITIQQSPVQSLEVTLNTPFTLFEGCEGSSTTDYEDEEYFRYDYSIYSMDADMVLTLKDGRVFNWDKVRNEFRDTDGKSLELDGNFFIYDDQEWDHWTVDNEYDITISYLGACDVVTVTIVPNPVISIAYIPVSDLIVEGTDYSTDDIPLFRTGDVFSVTTDEGTKDYVYGKFVLHEGEDSYVSEAFHYGREYIEPYQIDCNIDYESENNEVIVKYMGKTCTLPFTVVPKEETKKVTDISFEFVNGNEYIEGLSGYETRGTVGDTYFHYYEPLVNNLGNKLTVTYDDDSTDIFEYKNDGVHIGFYNSKDEVLKGDIYTTDHQESKHWGVGLENKFLVCYQGCQYVCYAVIKPNNIETVSFIPIQERIGYLLSNPVYSPYALPYFNNGDVIKTKDADGTVNTYTYTWQYSHGYIIGRFLDENGVWSRECSGYCEWEENANYTVGTDNYQHTEAFGKTLEIPFTLKRDDSIKAFSFSSPEPLDVFERNMPYECAEEDGTEYYTVYWKDMMGDLNVFRLGTFFRAGDTVTLTDSNDNATTYTFSQEPGHIGFYAEDGTQLQQDHMNGFDNGINPKDEGKCNVWTKDSINEIYLQYAGIQADPVRVFIGNAPVEKNDISNADITVGGGSFTYNGKAITPEVEVSYEGQVLTEGTDYILSYSSNKDAGTAVITISGTGDYTGEVTRNFTIGKADLVISTRDCTWTYDGLVHRDDEWTATGLAEGDSITVTTTGYITNVGETENFFQVDWGETNPANYNVTELAGRLRIVPKELRITAYSGTWVYDGTEHSAGDATIEGLVEGETVNVTTQGRIKNVGTVETTADISWGDTDPGNYNVIKSPGYLKVTPKTLTITTGSDEKTYDGTPLTNTEATSEGLVQGEEIEVRAVGTITDAGTVNNDCEITWVSALESNYKVVKNLGELKVNRADISLMTFPVFKAVTYTGKARTKTFTIKNGDLPLVKDTDYTVEYANNVNAGTADVIVTGIGNYTGTVTKNFTINKADQTITVNATTFSVAVGKTKTVTGSAKGTISFVSKDATIASVGSSTGVVTGKKVGTVTVTVKAAATTNYNAATKAVTIKVLPAATTSVTCTNLAKGIKVTWKKVTGATGYYVYRNDTQIKKITSGSTVTLTDTAAATNGKKYVYKVVAFAGTGKSTLSKSKTIYLVKQPAISSVTNSAAGKMTVKWAKNSTATGYEIQYSTSSTFASGKKTVTATGASTVSKVIGSLTKGKTYYVRLRTYKTVSGTKYYSAWSAKKSLKIVK